ncbi:MAG: hypothetical protein ACPG4W_08685, partial [Flavobacteriales bacterium]
KLAKFFEVFYLIAAGILLFEAVMNFSNANHKLGFLFLAASAFCVLINWRRRKFRKSYTENQKQPKK